ncbi:MULTISPECIES: acetyl-CoA carboxylase biotin carboxyl carrier protein subunit [Leptospira]|uniref:Acetyl-CoA carboxylase biotin carboxyl carrier protein subunit n=2 Tax=Leptospira TaxID=171 RepID=A0AAW5VRZ4_9LEPT|nr:MULTISPECIES: acetyl-CoA carboxylase biotin carboxyl carrier protein subunit [Leptospira]MCG6143458.1 acetyl-CoA carboxylase biotin carboxyl carrier protein subunit [Leptospira bandrabouensis]MCG6151500.1 acetyl-CoA carboxylase biotin carboxyl carrier protein subunit [Leptospira bandrabouensis]MCG6159118.1 acetyl-CoA carboxylase biotin carboxyl carrier protein subunit [Leptospira bandrabouensis]MCG6163052.1 acetyl-CoA carboxylase biotin carboxyl carrier protein subunit [Leptospira bandraboue
MDYLFETKTGPTSVHVSGREVRVRKGTNSIIYQMNDFIAKEIQASNPEQMATLTMKDGSILQYLKVRNEVFLHWKGEIWTAKLAERSYEGSGQTTPEIKSPMPGKVVQISTEVGREHKQGETLLILEAMKMENAVKAPYPCRVEEIRKSQGELVQQDEVLMILHRIDSEKT